MNDDLLLKPDCYTYVQLQLIHLTEFSYMGKKNIYILYKLKYIVEQAIDVTRKKSEPKGWNI